MSTCGNPTLLWSPDSKRFAFYWGQGRTHQTALYQFSGEKWIMLKTPGDEDEIEKRVFAEEAAKLKRKGMSKKAGGSGCSGTRSNQTDGSTLARLSFTLRSRR